jgi:uncharacterized membrane protein YphA (DoxX/SURF4 family)
MSANNASGPSLGLVLVRIVAGAVLMSAGWGKVSAGVDPNLVLGTREAFAEAQPLIRAWGENVVLPRPELFANLIAWGELLGGLALFLGAFTRPVGFAVLFMMANFWFVGPETARNMVLLLGACALGCAMSCAGRKIGMDVFLDERLPAWLTWTRG